MRRAVFSVLFLSSLTAALPADEPDLDLARSAWRFRREVTLGAPAGERPSFAALLVPPEVAASCQGALEDVRLLSPAGVEVPYVIDQAREREVTPTWSGRLIDTQSEKRQKTVWVVDLGASRSFDRILLQVPEQDFAKRLRIEVSDDRAEWRNGREDVGVFDRMWNGRLHHTEVVLIEATDARFLRITADDQRSKPISLTGVTVSATRRVKGATTRRAAELTWMRTEGGWSRYRIELPPGFPFEALEIGADDPAFLRRVRVLEARENNGRRDESVLGEGQVFRLRIADESLSAESVVVSVRPGKDGERVLEIQDQDSPPLSHLRVTVSSTATRLLFPLQPGPFRLYYGNPVTHAPVYDLDALKGRIGLAPGYVVTQLGPEAINPRFNPAPPLPFAALRGASLDEPRWRAERALKIVGREDLYSVTLAAEDLGLLRRDLGDLRLVDTEGRQLPYVLEAGAAEALTDLEVNAEPASALRPSSSRYRLAVAARFSGKPLSLPLIRLELAFEDRFFSRAAVLTAPPPPGARGERPILSTRIEKAADQRSVERSAPIVLPLGGAESLSELILEIDAGDNQPLRLTRVRGAVSVPRIAFKAEPGSYRLLLGNPAALPPRYDIASLRNEILAYSAVPATAQPVAPNAVYRRKVSDYFVSAPPTLVLWASLGVAVLALLALTARIVRQPPAP